MQIWDKMIKKTEYWYRIILMVSILWYPTVYYLDIDQPKIFLRSFAYHIDFPTREGGRLSKNMRVSAACWKVVGSNGAYLSSPRPARQSRQQQVEQHAQMWRHQLGANFRCYGNHSPASLSFDRPFLGLDALGQELGDFRQV